MADRHPQETSISITPIQTAAAAFLVVGTMPLIINRVSEKAQHELLYPSGRTGAADRAAKLKHRPLEEFRASPYLSDDPQAPTYLIAPAMWFKNGMKSAALDLPGATKTQIGRLCFVEGEYVPIWGVPQLHMTITRSADMGRTPDVRSRAIVPKWAAAVPIRWVEPLLNRTTVANLLNAAGILSGAGDWRQQKGAGNYGQYRLADPDDAEFLAIVAGGGYREQAAAMDEPACYDRDTQELLSWFDGEVKRRGTKGTG